MEFKVTVFVFGSGIERFYDTELLEDPALRASLAAKIGVSGGLLIECDLNEVMFDDDFGHLVQSLLIEAPVALRAGQDYGMELRYSPGRIDLTGKGDEVTFTLTDSRPISAPRAAVIQGLEDAAARYARLSALLA